MKSEAFNTARLGTISEMRLGLSTSVADSGIVPMIRVGDLVHPIQWQDVRRAQLNITEVRDFLLKDGDVLLARSGVGSVGNVQAVVNPPTAVFASYVIRIRPLPGWYGPYIAFYLKSPSGNSSLHSRAQGATIVNLSAARISSITIPEVPHDEQVAIAKNLQSAEISYLSAQEKLTRARAGIEQLKRRLYTSAIESSDIGESSDSWDTAELATITDNLDRDRVPLNADTRRQRPGDIPYYGASGVIDHVNEATHDGMYVLISEDGNNLLSRKTNIAFVATGKFWANNHVHVVRPHDEILPEFLALQVNSLDLENVVTGTAQPKLSQLALNRIPIQVPSLDIQRAILQTAAGLQNSYIRLLDTQRLIASHLDTAWAEILEDAFKPSGVLAGPLEVEEALEWLDEVAPLLQSVVSDERASRRSVQGTSQAEVDTAVAPLGWLTVREAFDERYQKIAPDELEDRVDDFYAWLKAGLESGEIELRRDGEDTYLRVPS